MKDDYRGTNPLDEFARGHWPQGFKFKRDGYSGNYKTVVTTQKGYPAGKSEEKSRFLDELDHIALYVATVVHKKHLDYGAAGILDAPYGPIKGVITRLHDKIARAINLTKNDSSPENESLRDTFIDIAGYAFIAITLLDDKFPKK